MLVQTFSERVADGTEKTFLQGYAAATAAQMSGAVIGLPGKFPILDCCFRSFSTGDCYRRCLQMEETKTQISQLEGISEIIGKKPPEKACASRR